MQLLLKINVIFSILSATKTCPSHNQSICTSFVQEKKFEMRSYCIRYAFVNGSYCVRDVRTAFGSVVLRSGRWYWIFAVFFLKRVEKAARGRIRVYKK